MAKKSTESHEFQPAVSARVSEFGGSSQQAAQDVGASRRNPAPHASIPMVPSPSRKVLLTR